MKLITTILMITYSIAALADKQFSWGNDRLTRLEYGVKKTCEGKGGILEREARLDKRTCTQVVCKDKSAHVVCKAYTHRGRTVYNPEGLYARDYGKKKFYYRTPASYDYDKEEDIYYYNYSANEYVGDSVSTSFNECVQRYSNERKGRLKCHYLLEGLTYSQCTRFYSDSKEGHWACGNHYYPHQTIKSGGRIPASVGPYGKQTISNEDYRRGSDYYAPYYWSNDYYRVVDPEFVEVESH